MSASSTPRRRYSLADYLAVEEASTVRHEYLEGQILALAGGTPEHSALAAAVTVLLGTRLAGGPCRVYNADLRVRVLATGLATYPDAAVVCGEIARDPVSPTHVTNPSVLVEVLSPSTEEYDRTEKREHYQRIESLQAYVLIAQDQRRVEVYARDATGGWQHRVHEGGGVVEIGSLGVHFPTDDLYDAAGIGTNRGG